MVLHHTAQTVRHVELWLSCDNLDASDVALEDMGI